MTKDELKNILLNAIKENKGKTPLRLIIEDKDYTWNGCNRIGYNTLYKYRLSSEIEEVKDEKLIML